MIALIFIVLFVGLWIGKVKIFNVNIGLAGILIASILTGFLIANISVFNQLYFLEICDFISSLGTAIFISTIGIMSGKLLFKESLINNLKALAAGVCVTIIGVVIAIICCKLDGNMSKDMVLGLLAGSMTSTPTLSAAKELCGGAAEVALGYGIAYCSGLLSIVLFVQFVAHKNDFVSEQSTHSISKAQESLGMIAISIVMGQIFNGIFSIGNTMSILLFSIIVGIIFGRRCETAELNIYKKFGLSLFLVGVGIPAGSQLIGNIMYHYILYGIIISCFSVLLGYILIRFAFGFSKNDALCVLCGGMTSTPAIAVLQQKDSSAKISLYTTSYIGALISLILFVKLMYYVT